MTTWIFKISPDQLDLDALLETSPPAVEIPVRQNAREIQQGDQVFLWRGRSTKVGNDGLVGIVAEGIVGTPPAVEPVGTDVPPPSITPRPATPVDVRLMRTKLKERVGPSWFNNDPVMSRSMLIKSDVGSEFRMTGNEAARINALWRNGKTKWSYAETVAGLWAFTRTRGGPVSRGPESPVSIAALRVGRMVQSVYNRVQHFRAMDAADERAGLNTSSIMERIVWTKFFDATADALRSDDIEAEFARLWPDDGAKPLPLPPSAEELATPLTKLSIEQLLARYARRAPLRSPRPRTYRTNTTVFDRDELVIAIALVRAGRRCEVPNCAHVLFETSEGKSFVEVHHIDPLAEGGDDTPENVACVCPSHHREAHHGTAAAAIRTALLAIRAAEGAAVTSALQAE